MQTYYAFVRTGVGAFIRVTVQAENTFAATQMLKAMYGEKLISDFACPA